MAEHSITSAKQDIETAHLGNLPSADNFQPKISTSKILEDATTSNFEMLIGDQKANADHNSVAKDNFQSKISTSKIFEDATTSNFEMLIEDQKANTDHNSVVKAPLDNLPCADNSQPKLSTSDILEEATSNFEMLIEDQKLNADHNSVAKAPLDNVPCADNSQPKLSDILEDATSNFEMLIEDQKLNTNHNSVAEDELSNNINKEVKIKEFSQRQDSSSSSCNSDDSEDNDSSISTNSSTVSKNSKIKPRKKFVIEEGFEKLPPVEQLDINIDHSHLKELGNVSGIVEVMVMVKPTKEFYTKLQMDCVLFRENTKPLGKIWDVLGLVTAPMYGVRFNTAEEISECNIKVGDKIYYAPNNPDYTEVILVEQMKKMNFTDATGENDQEVYSEEDFSDDEVEKKKKSKKSNTKRKPTQDTADVVHHRQNKNLHAKKASFDQSHNSNVWHKKNHQPCSYPQAPQTQNKFELKSPQLQQTHPYSQSQQNYCQSPQTWPQSQPIHPQFQPTHPHFQQTLPQFSMARPPHPSGLPRPQFNSHKNSHQPHFPNNHQNYDNSGDVNSHMFPAQRFHNPYPSASPYNYASVGAYPGNPFAVHPSPVNSLTDCQTPVHQTTNNNNMRNTYVYPSNSFRPRQTHPRYNN